MAGAECGGSGLWVGFMSPDPCVVYIEEPVKMVIQGRASSGAPGEPVAQPCFCLHKLQLHKK